MIEFKYGSIRRGNQEADISVYRGRVSVTLGGTSVDGYTAKKIVDLMLKHYETREIGSMKMLQYKDELYAIRNGKLRQFTVDDIWRWSYKKENELPEL